MRDDDIKHAYGAMEPSPEAEARMLDTILASANAAATNDRIVYDGTELTEENIGSSRDRRKKPLWHIALPIAACLIVLAGIGVFALGMNPGDTTNTLNLSASKATEEKAMSDQEAPDTSGGSAANNAPSANGSFAHRFPIIELKAGNILRIVTTDGSVPLVIDESKIGEELGTATAKSEDGTSSMECSVFEYHDEKYPYAIRYVGDPEYHLAVPVKD